MHSICIIEDDMVSQFATRYCLEQFAAGAFAISTFDSAEAALDAFQALIDDDNDLPNIIFLDLGLGKMDGWAFIEELQILLKTKIIPEIYVLSAFGKASDRELAQRHPLVLGYIHKPLTKSRLEGIFETC